MCVRDCCSCEISICTACDLQLLTITRRQSVKVASTLSDTTDIQFFSSVLWLFCVSQLVIILLTVLFTTALRSDWQKDRHQCHSVLLSQIVWYCTFSPYLSFCRWQWNVTSNLSCRGSRNKLWTKHLHLGTTIFVCLNSFINEYAGEKEKIKFVVKSFSESPMFTVFFLILDTEGWKSITLTLSLTLC